VVEAVEAGRFQVYPVQSVDEALAILSGQPSGERDALGRFPPGSVNLRVEERLAAFAERVRAFTAGPAGRKEWRRGRPR
jgi:predicted ATP-dependent protease